ncbi:MAG: hypothetical protein ACREH9_08485 [Pseudomonadota bacterium]
MKHLLNGVAVVAALVVAAPAWAQQGGNGMGMPGPNPGGGGRPDPLQHRSTPGPRRSGTCA